MAKIVGPKRFVIMCGLPGSGKTTYRKANYPESMFVSISTDDIIETIKPSDVSYEQAFSSYYKHANRLMHEKLQKALKAGDSIVWDQTNITKNKRKKIFSLIPDDYLVTLVIINISKELYIKRNETRKDKKLSSKTLNQLYDSYQYPDAYELSEYKTHQVINIHYED